MNQIAVSPIADSSLSTLRGVPGLTARLNAKGLKAEGYATGYPARAPALGGTLDDIVAGGITVRVFMKVVFLSAAVSFMAGLALLH